MNSPKTILIPVSLLNALLAIDPAAATEISRKILATPTTADEWALALRNIGKVESFPESIAYLRATTEELTRLAADTALHASRPEMTAQQFARADLRDPAQRDIVKTWLLDPARTATELRSFAATYPNNNQFISHNLLTTAPPPSGTDLAAHDREVLEIVTTWQTDPVFQPILEHLPQMIARFNKFVGVGKIMPTQTSTE